MALPTESKRTKRQTEPVTYGHHNGGGALFDNHPRLKNKALLLDITTVNPCTGSNLGNAARHVGKHLADAVQRKKNKYRGSFPATYSLLPLAMSTCGDVGSDVHALIKELAIRTSSTIGGWRGCNIFVPVLRGNGTKIAPTGDKFDQPPGQIR